MKMTTRLRQLLDDGLVVAPGCFDAFSARLAHRTGFKAIHMTGYGLEASLLGAPDIGILTLSEVAEQAARMTSAISIPMLADIDTGFGGVFNVQRTIREMERAGVAGVHMEDQVFPKRCPVLAGRQVLDRNKAVDRVKAALDARTDPDFVIVARCDADVVSINEVIERCNLYLETGADMVMPMTMVVDGKNFEALSPQEQMELKSRLASSISGRVMDIGRGPPPGYTVEDLEKAGYSFMMYAGSVLLAAANAMGAVLNSIMEHGSDQPFFSDNSGPFRNSMDIMRAVRLDEFLAIDEAFS